MSSEILSVLEYMEKEKGIGREDMISTIVTAIKNAAAKGVNAGQELKVDIDPKNGKMQAWALLEVGTHCCADRSSSDHATFAPVRKRTDLR
jgi:N utilization substance protein A